MQIQFSSIVTILFIVNLIDFAQLQNEPKTELQNWIQTIPGLWPKKNGGKDGPFYFYHSEANERALFGMSKQLLDGTVLATGTLDLLFKYWTNSGTSKFVSRTDKTIDEELNPSLQWEKSSNSLKNLTLNQFRRLKFMNLYQFTAAFKDVKVQYLEEMTPTNLEWSPIHGYKTEPESKLSKNVKLEKDETNSKTVKVQASQTGISYLNLVESQPNDKELCYQISQLPPNKKIEVYFTFESLASGIKLLTIDSKKSQTKFCINDFIALKNIRNFQLTFVINEKIDQEFKFTITRIEEIAKGLVIRNAGEEKGDITSGWYYYNSMYGFAVRAPENAKFSACDIVGNCYPYNVYGGVNGGKQKYNIREGFKRFLGKSPFFRIQIDDDESLVKDFEFSEHSDKSAMELFRKNLISENKYFQDSEITQASPIPPTNSQQIGQRIQILNHKFDNKTKKIVLKIPLNQIDLRSHQLVTEFKTKSSPKPFVYLVNLSYRNELTGKVVNFPFESDSDQELKIIKLDHIRFSTETLFAVHPSDPASNNKFIEISLEEIYPNTTIDITFDIQKSTLKQIEHEDGGKVQLKYLSSSNPSNITLVEIEKPNLKLEKNKFAIIFSDWIRAATEQKLSEAKFESTFNLVIEDQNNATAIWSTDDLLNSILVYRMILTQNDHILQLIPTENFTLSDSKNKTLTFNDILDTETAKRQLSGSFRIAYAFILKANFAINIQVNKFHVQSPVKQNQNCRELTLASVDCKYEDNILPDTFENGKPARIYQFKEIECDPKISGCSNIFNQSLAISSVYAQQTNPRYIPHQTKENDDITQHYLKISFPSNLDTDYCVQFDYKSKSNSLLINANETNTIIYSIEYPETGINQNTKLVNEKQSQIVCASYLSNNVQDIKSLYFRFSKSQIIDTDDFYVTNVRKVSPETNSLEVFKGIELNELLSTQFIRPETTEWTFINDRNLKFLVTNLNYKRKENGDSLVSFLRTKWFEAPNPDNFGEFRLGFKLTGDDLKREHYQLSVIVSSVEKELFKEVISNTKNELINDDKMHIFPITPKSIKHYQMTLKLELDLSALEFKHENEKQLNFTFESLTLNDPCVDEKTNRHVSCNGHAQTCTRRYDTFSPKCNCEDGFVGNYCQTDDYCKKRDAKSGQTNDQRCSSQPKCRNNYVIGEFECVCGAAQEWDHASKSCIDKAVKCKENEYSTFGRDGQVQCDCIHDYVRVNSNCEKFNPCNLEHRNVRGFSTKACADSNAKCQINEEAASGSESSYICECNSGFVNQFSNKMSDAKCLHQKCEVEIGTCEHKCIPKGEKYECSCFDGYSLENGKCKLKDSKINEKCQSKATPTPFVNAQGNCECIQGYKWNETVCLLETDKNSYFGKKFQCESAVELVDSKPACVCTKKNQVLDLESRSCKSKTECAKIEAEKCKKDHNSDKCSPDKVSGEPLCGCDVKTQVKYASTDKEIDKWTCVAKCDLFLRGFKEQGCNGAFQECLDQQVEVTKRNETFIGDTSKITSENSNIHGHCACGLGFEQSSKDPKACKQRKVPQVDLVIDFSVDESLNIIEAYFRELIQTAIQPNVIDRIECKKGVNKTKLVWCRGSFPFDQPIDPKRALLDKLCKPLENSPGKCAYLLTKIERLQRRSLGEGTFYQSPTQWSGILVREKGGQIKLEQINLCESSSPCKSFDYSYCHKSNDSSSSSHYITCQCDDSIFDIKSELTVGKYQSCKLKDLCTLKQFETDYGCKSDVNCSLKVDYDTVGRKYVAQSFCTCGSNLTLPNRSLSCKQTCNGACGENSDSCAQDLYDPKRFICKCKDGYKGDKCQDKEGLNIFLYATIGASVVALIALISLGVFCFKRNSKNIRRRTSRN